MGTHSVRRRAVNIVGRLDGWFIVGLGVSTWVALQKIWGIQME
jgi:hypothetical protein